MDKIVVILSTYNGEKYLQEQIASILKQNEVEVKLLIRDDGSSDNTYNMLQDIRDRNPSVETLFQENVGCKKSFYLAAQYAFETFPDTDY